MKDAFDKYSDKKQLYEELLEKDESVFVHHRNTQALVMEMYKVKSEYKPKIFNDFSNQREISPYNLRGHPGFVVTLTRTVYHASKSISYLGQKIWDINLASIKQALPLNSFKRLIKKWVPQVWRLCKNYIVRVGFAESLL